MDALLINIAKSGPGQSALGSGGSTPDGGETAFGEALSAAMTASMQTAVTPEQSVSETPVDGSEGRFLAVLNRGADPGAQPDLLVSADQPAGHETPLDVPELLPKAPHASTDNLRGRTKPDASVATPATQAPDVAMAEQSGTQLPNANGEGAGSIAASEKLRAAVRSSSGLEKQLPSTTGLVRPSSAGSMPASFEQRIDGPPVAPHQQQDPTAYDLSQETQSNLSVRPIVGTSDASLTSSVERGLLAEPGDGRIAANNADLQTAHPLNESASLRAPHPSSANTGHTALIDPISTAASELTKPAEASPQAISSSGVSTLDIDGQRDLAQLLAMRPDGQAGGARPSPSHRPAKPLVDGVRPQLTIDGVSVPPTEARAQSVLSPGQGLRPEAQFGPTPAVATGQKPMASALQTLSTNPLAQASRVEDSGFADANRFQSPIAADGVPIDGARFEPTSAIGSSRSSTLPTPAAPGLQIGLQIARSLAHGVERLTVHLHPAELGSVDIQLNFEDSGRLTAQIVAERPETLELLQRDSRLLERSLGDNGLKLTNEGLSFSLKQDQQQQAGQQFQQQSDARQTAFGSGRAYNDATAIEDQPVDRRVDGLRLLDIRT